MIRRVVIVAVIVAAPVATASIGAMQQLKLDFTKPDVPKLASWTKNDKLVRDAKGLRFDAPQTDSLEVAIQTTDPYAIGTSWRPARGVQIAVHVTPPFQPIKLDNGQTSQSYPGRMFVRYSADAKHWSNWHLLPEKSTAKAMEFSGEIEVARADSAEYDELLRKYAKLDVPWRSDEEAAANWIAGAQPDFFAKHQPFVGYLQFLYETNLSGGQPIAHIDIEMAYSVGGGAYAPKDPKARENREGPWRYRAK